MAFLQQTPIESFVKRFIVGDEVHFPNDTYENRRKRALTAYNSAHKMTTYKNESIMTFKEYIQQSKEV